MFWQRLLWSRICSRLVGGRWRIAQYLAYRPAVVFYHETSTVTQQILSDRPIIHYTDIYTWSAKSGLSCQSVSSCPYPSVYVCLHGAAFASFSSSTLIPNGREEFWLCISRAPEQYQAPSSDHYACRIEKLLSIHGRRLVGYIAPSIPSGFGCFHHGLYCGKSRMHRNFPCNTSESGTFIFHYHALKNAVLLPHNVIIRTGNGPALAGSAHPT